ncbi:MAG: TetR family transcriptional regulator [Desulfohalobiaceae bacterium]
MPESKVISIDSEKRIREKLIAATGRVLAREGFGSLDRERVAREAGVAAGNIIRCFGGLEGLVDAYGQSEAFWPSARELMEDAPQGFAELSPEQQVAAFSKSLLAALRRRPETMDILAWEAVERNDYSRRLEEIRVRVSLEYFENLQGEIPEGTDLSAIVALLAGAVQFVAARSRRSSSFGGIALNSEKGWQRIDRAIEALMSGSFAASAQNGALESSLITGRTPGSS